MDFYGNINLKDNEMQKLVFEQETSFPVDAVVGSIVFKDNTLYMCVALNVADPIWIPLTSSIDTYVHEQNAASTTWTITHSLGEENIVLQVYNDSNDMIIPDTVTPTDTNEIVMTFGTAITGRAILMFGDTIPANGIGIIDPAIIGILLFTLDNPNFDGASAGDDYGFAVAVDGNVVVVSSISDDGGGTVYVFDTTLGSLTHTLINPTPYGTRISDNFGSSVAISGNNIIIGAQGEDDAGGLNSGKAYIYNATTGALIHTIDNPNAGGGSAGDIFGDSVAIDGNNAIVGAYSDDAGGSSSGTAYIFNVTTGALVHTLANPNAFGTVTDDRFGYAIDISGNNAIVGAWREDGAGGTDSGKAYIFNVTTGALVHTLDNPNAFGTSGGDDFGYHVAISGNNATVCAPFEDDASGSAAGKAYIFNVTTGALVHTLDNPNAFGTGGSDIFGRSGVAMSDSNVIIGTHNESDPGGTNAGKAYMFDVATGTLIFTFDNPNSFGTSDSDFFGWSVGIDDNNVIVGAIGEDDITGLDAGNAYLFGI